MKSLGTCQHRKQWYQRGPQTTVYFEIKKPPWVSVVWVVIACCICSKHDPCICSKQCTAPAGKKVFATQYLTYITKIALLRYNYIHSTLIWNPVFMSDTCVTLVWHLCDTSVTLVWHLCDTCVTLVWHLCAACVTLCQNGTQKWTKSTPKGYPKVGQEKQWKLCSRPGGSSL